jgi:hypothetical protein
MAKTVIGLFDSFDEAQRAVDDLLRFGVRRDDISLVARDEHGDMSRAREVGDTGAAESAGAGAVGGSLVGGALGLLVGTGLLIIPGIGPVLAAGPLAAGIGTIAAAAGATALGAGLGAAAGGLLGGLLGAGVPEDEAQAYVEGVRRGGTLLSVQAADVEADDVREIMIRNGAVDMGRRSDEWRTGGWAGGQDNNIDTTAVEDNSIPRGDSYSIAGHQAVNEYEDSSKAGTVTGTAAGAATGAMIGAPGGPIGAVVGGVAGAITGAAAGAAGDVAGERAEDAGERGYRFKDGGLNDVDRKVVDTSYTDMDRTGNRQKDTGFESGNSRPQSEPEQFGEWVDEGERSFRTPENTRTGERIQETGALAGAGGAAYRPDGHNVMAQNAAAGQPTDEQGALLSESGRRSPQYAGADQMGGAVSNMRSGSGSEQPGREASAPGGSGRRVRIYDNAAGGAVQREAAADEAPLPAHGDFARGMRDEPAPAAEPDFARGMHTGRDADRAHAGHDTSEPHHGDFARGMRQEEPSDRAPDYARGQRSYELYDADFVAHHQNMTGAGGMPYDHYKPGYQFGFDLANNPSYRHASWAEAERDARTSWERDNRNDWEQFKDTIRYGWEKARGRA